jgi:type I restriction enzyme S subunit
MATYKIVEENQFVYGPVTSRNGERIAIARCEVEKCIVSVSYTVFEIIKPRELLPEYLMMWFRRPEFDRYARFMSHGSVRELFGWEEMSNVELPVPSPEKQLEIVAEYRVVVDRVRLNGRLKEKLEETAQAIYRRWFVDFEFPMTADQARALGKPELESQPYKSSGGGFVYNETLNQEIPVGWTDARLDAFGNIVTGKTPSSANPEHFGSNTAFVTPTDFDEYHYHVHAADRYLSKAGLVPLSKKRLPPGSILTTCIGSNMGKTVLARVECVTNQQLNSIVLNENAYSEFLLFVLRGLYKELRNLATGSSTMLMINKTDFSKIRILRPPLTEVSKFSTQVQLVTDFMAAVERTSLILSRLHSVVLSGLASKEAQ